MRWRSLLLAIASGLFELRRRFFVRRRKACRIEPGMVRRDARQEAGRGGESIRKPPAAFGASCGSGLRVEPRCERFLPREVDAGFLPARPWLFLVLRGRHAAPRSIRPVWLLRVSFGLAASFPVPGRAAGGRDFAAGLVDCSPVVLSARFACPPGPVGLAVLVAPFDPCLADSGLPDRVGFCPARRASAP